MYAARALGELRYFPSVEKLASLPVGNPLEGERFEAVRALGRLGGPVAMAALVKALRDEGDVPQTRVRLEARAALLKQAALCVYGAVSNPSLSTWECFGAEAGDGLREGLKNGDPVVREAAALVLGRLRDRGSAEQLSTLLLRDGSEKVRSAAAAALGAIGMTEGAEALVAALSDPSQATTTAAVGSLQRLGHPAFEALARMDPPDDATRIRRIRALAHFGSPAIHLLARELREKDNQVVLEAVAALGQTRLPEAIAPLMVALAMPDGVSGPAGEAIGVIGDEALPALAAALREPSPAIRAAAARALGKVGGEQAAPLLVAALRDSVEPVAEAAASALQSVEVWAKDRLVKALEDPLATVRYHALNALGLTATRAALNGALRLLNDPAPNVATKARYTLEQMADASCLPALEAALEGATGSKRKTLLDILRLRTGKDYAAPR